MHLNSRFVMWNDWKDWNGWNSKNDWNDWNQPNRQTSENYVELILYQILQHRAHFSTRNKNHASVMLTLANTQISYKKTPLLLVGFICGLFEVSRYILGRTHNLKKFFCATVDVEKNSKVSNKNTRMTSLNISFTTFYCSDVIGMTLIAQFWKCTLQHWNQRKHGTKWVHLHPSFPVPMHATGKHLNEDEHLHETGWKKTSTFYFNKS